jgi:hypothetical protein
MRQPPFHEPICCAQANGAIAKNFFKGWHRELYMYDYLVPFSAVAVGYDGALLSAL